MQAASPFVLVATTTIDEIKWISYTPEHTGRIDRLREFEEKEQIMQARAELAAIQKANEETLQRTRNEKIIAYRAKHR